MDTLTRIKKRLNIDQRNLVSARVLSVTSSTARVRLPDGSERTAYMPDGANVGDLVSVQLSGRTATVQGSAPLQPTAGEKIVILS